MSLASLFGGMALANARLGAVHGMANPIGGMYSRSTWSCLCPFAATRDGNEFASLANAPT